MDNYVYCKIISYSSKEALNELFIPDISGNLASALEELTVVVDNKRSNYKIHSVRLQVIEPVEIRPIN